METTDDDYKKVDDHGHKHDHNEVDFAHSHGDKDGDT